MRHGNLKEAPNYTNAALIMGGVNLFWMFLVIWASLGFWAVLVTGYALDRLILWLAARRCAR